MKLESVATWRVAPALRNLLDALDNPCNYTRSRVDQLWAAARIALEWPYADPSRPGPTTAELREMGFDPSRID